MIGTCDIIARSGRAGGGGMEFSRLFIPNPRNLTEADVREIYTNALE